MRRICVFGAGAIGGHLAARLARGRAEVSVVARGAHLAAIRADGLTVRAPDGEIRVRLAATENPAELGPQDAVLVTAKAPALPELAAGLAPLLGPATPVVFVTNGIPWWYFHRHGGVHDGRRLARLDPDDVLLRAVGLDRAVGAVVHSACEVVAPAVVQVDSSRNLLILGEIDGVDRPRLHAIVGFLRAGGMAAEVTGRIRDAVWTKLVGNLCGGPMGVLTQALPSETFADPVCEAAMCAVVAEGQAIARALGAAAAIDLEAQIASGKLSRHKTSIQQDLERGRPMEVDARLTVPMELGRLAGVATPTLDLIVALVRHRARSAGLYRG